MKFKFIQKGTIGLLLTLFVLTGCTSKIQMKDYTEVNFFGPNGDGIAEVSFDYDLFILDVQNKSKDKNFINYVSLYDNVQIEPDKETELKNGDVVTVNFKIDKKFNRVKTAPLKVKVLGLKDPIKLTKEAIIDNLDIELSGLSGSGDMSFTYKSDAYPFSNLILKVDNNGSLSNEENALIKAELNIDYSGRDEIYILDEKEFQLEVNGLTEIPKDLSNVDNLDDFKQVMKETIEGNFPSDREQIEFLNFYYRASVPNNPAITSGGSWGNPHSQYGEVATLAKRTIVSGYNEGQVEYYMFISGENTLEDNKLSLKNAQELSRHNFKKSFGLDTTKTIIAEDKFIPID